MIKFDNIGKKFSGNSSREVEALAGISFEVKDNEFVSIVGPSGCGKTTLLRIVANLVKNDTGSIIYSGTEQPTTALVFQDTGLLPWLTVMENACLGLELQKVGKAEREMQGRAFLNLIKLDGFEKHYPHELSGGMKQRVALARAFLTNPDILLMDEPFGALDAQSRLLMQEELLNLWARDKKIVLFVTHDIDESILLSDRIIVMSHRPGQIQQVIEVDFPRPRDLSLRDDPAFVQLRKQIWKLMEHDIRGDLNQVV